MNTDGRQEFSSVFICVHLWLINPNSHAKRVVRVEQQRRLGADVGRAGDARDDALAVAVHAPLEDAADDALLPPDVALLDLTVGEQAGELGAGAGAARRAVVRL